MSELVGGSPAEPPDPREPGPAETVEATAPGPPAGPPRESAPRAVRTAAVLMYVVAGLALVQGLLSIVASALNRTRLVSALLALVFATAYVVLAGRARRGDRTARTVALALSGLSVLGGVLQLGANPAAGVVGLLLNGGIITLLAFHPASRRFFGPHADSASG